MKDDDDTLCYRSELEAAVKAEREACAKLADSLGWVNVDHIKARGQA